MRKEKIYNEVINMLNDRVDYKSITLIEVANRCNIGKSTLYEYFDSKDEMIYNSILYYLSNTIKFFSENFEITTFHTSLKTYIKALTIIMKGNFWMVMPWTFLDNYAVFFTEEDALNIFDMLYKCQEIIFSLFKSIVDKGEEEGTLFHSNETRKKFAFNGLVSSISEMVKIISEEEDEMVQFLEDMVSCIVKELN